MPNFEGKPFFAALFLVYNELLTFIFKKRIVLQQARMVELVDTLVSGTSAVTGMEVQVFFRAKEMPQHSI